MISTLSHLFRLGGVGLVCAREGLFSLVDPAPLPPQLRLVWRVGRLIERPSAVDPKHRLSTTVPALGPAYVKLGQILATRPDVVGPALARDLRSLQDRMPPFSQAEAEKTVAAALNKKLSDVFVTFGPPVAAASIAQVHRAEIETPSGRRSQSAAPQHREALCGRPCGIRVRGPECRAPVGRGAAATARRSDRNPWPFGRA